MNKLIYPPWTQDQVDALNRHQNDDNFHPMTCGGDRHDDAHRKRASEHDEEHGQLLATPDGWICPACGYTQGWAHEGMLSELTI